MGDFFHFCRTDVEMLRMCLLWVISNDQKLQEAEVFAVSVALEARSLTDLARWQCQSGLKKL